MSKSIYQSYEEGTARDRAELIFKYFCIFAAIIDDCKARLVYEIQAEEQFSRSHNRDELGVRIQKLGHYSDPTAKEAIDKVALEEGIEETGEIHLRTKPSQRNPFTQSSRCQS
ncbi:MAG: hypothetical protein IK081_12875 [Lachnospiraceae bacterium]|nr:hypothetical protein [Lachnospiraceae bacterium]